MPSIPGNIRHQYRSLVPDGERGIGVLNRQGKRIFTIYSLLPFCLYVLKRKINPHAKTVFTAALFIIAKK